MDANNDRAANDETSATEPRKHDRSTVVSGIILLMVFSAAAFWLIAGHVGYQTVTCSVVSARTTTVGSPVKHPGVVVHTRECGDVRYAYGISKQLAQQLAKEYDATTTCRFELSWFNRMTPDWWGDRPVTTPPDCR